MTHAASRIDWTRLRTCFGLNATTISSLLTFQKWNVQTKAKMNFLEEQAKEVDFNYYRSILKNKTLVDEIEREVKGFVPLKYRVDEQMKAIKLFEEKAVENAKKMEDKVVQELVELKETLSRIEGARPVEELTVEEVISACPKINEKVEEMIKEGRWSVPGYKEKFGDLTIM